MVLFRKQLILPVSAETTPSSGVGSPERVWNGLFWTMTKVRPSLWPTVLQIRSLCFRLLSLPATRSKCGSDNQSHICAAGQGWVWKPVIEIQVTNTLPNRDFIRFCYCSRRLTSKSVVTNSFSEVKAGDGGVNLGTNKSMRNLWFFIFPFLNIADSDTLELPSFFHHSIL